MSWKITTHKEPKSEQELRVKVLLREMVEYGGTTYAGEFERSFKEEVKKIPKTNIYSADLMFKVTQRNLKSVEIWKLDVKGDFKHKMFTLDYLETKS